MNKLEIYQSFRNNTPKLTNSQMQKVNELFLGASPEQMNEMANIFNEVRSLKAASAAQSFAAGQKVKWSGRRGAMEGVVVKSLKKNIRVKATNGDMWNVAATILKAA